MPYPALSDLPAAVRRLPLRTRHIFRAAFNSAWQSYAGYEPQAREEIAFRVAWAAVKRRYRKIGDIWITKDGLGIGRRD